MRKNRIILLFLIGSLYILILFHLERPVCGTNTVYLNNINNDFTFDGYTNIWYNTPTDQRDISVRYDSTVNRIITGLKVHYRTARLLAPYADCPTTYKFESGVSWVDYNDAFPNTSGANQTHEFHCQGDTFLVTNSFFYISMGCGLDDPYIQVGVDAHRSGRSEYSLNGGSWTLDTVEYIVEALVENITTAQENAETIGTITINTDFVDAYNVSLLSNDDAHFIVEASDSNEHFDMRFFTNSVKLTSDSNAIWLDEGSTSQKNYRYVSSSAQNYIILIEPHIDGIDNGTYSFSWTYDPDPPVVNAIPSNDNDGNISLTWNPPSDLDLHYYNVYRSTNPNVPIDFAHRITVPGTLMVPQFNDNYLLNDTYYYVVTSVDNTGHESKASNEVFTTVGDIIRPSPPHLNIPLAYPIDYDGNILINWSLTNPNDIISCNIYRSNHAGFQLNSSTYLMNILKSSTIHEDYPLLSGTYYYRVASIDINSLESLSSNEVNTTYIDITPPSTPQNVKCKDVDDDNVDISWDRCLDRDISYYKVFRSEKEITSKDLNILTPICTTIDHSWTDEGLSEGKYYYVVVAIDLNGLESSVSECDAVEFSESEPPAANYIILLVLILSIIIGALVATSVIVYRKRNQVWPTYGIRNKLTSFTTKIKSRINKNKEKRVLRKTKDIDSFKTEIVEKPQIDSFSEELNIEAELTYEEVEQLKTAQFSEKLKDFELASLAKKSLKSRETKNDGDKKS